MSLTNWRTINIDALDPESPANFDIATLTPGLAPLPTENVQSIVGQIRQLLRGGDTEGALRGALETVPYGADARGKELHLAAVIEILQSIRQADMTPILTRLYQSEGGSELLDVLMKYIYRGMAAGPSSQPAKAAPQATGFSQMHSRPTAEGGGQAMSVLLSWHEKVVEVAGPGSIVRVMTDRRTV